jgi:hypothetical protein
MRGATPRLASSIAGPLNPGYRRNSTMYWTLIHTVCSLARYYFAWFCEPLKATTQLYNLQDGRGQGEISEFHEHGPITVLHGCMGNSLIRSNADGTVIGGPGLRNSMSPWVVAVAEALENGEASKNLTFP